MRTIESATSHYSSSSAASTPGPFTFFSGGRLYKLLSLEDKSGPNPSPEHSGSLNPESDGSKKTTLKIQGICPQCIPQGRENQATRKNPYDPEQRLCHNHYLIAFTRKKTEEGRTCHIDPTHNASRWFKALGNASREDNLFLCNSCYYITKKTIN